MEHIGKLLYSLALLVSYALASAPFGNRVNLGTVNTMETEVDEASGLAASRIHANVLYTHNDKGGTNDIYAIDAISGKRVAKFTIRDTALYDWEDLAIGPCVDDCKLSPCSASVQPSRYCIYIAEIGDHGGDGALNNIYMVREPLSLVDSTIDVVSTLKFNWTEPDAETLMITPTGELYVISKVKNRGAMMALLPNSAWDGPRVTLDMAKAVQIRLATTKNDPQGGDISPQGTEMLLVYEEGMYYFPVSDGDFLKAVATQDPQPVTTYQVLPSTEAVAWRPNNQGFYTLPEGIDQVVAFYPRADAIIG